jgi:hypothetical protein
MKGADLIPDDLDELAAFDGSLLPADTPQASPVAGP